MMSLSGCFPRECLHLQDCKASSKVPALPRQLNAYNPPPKPSRTARTTNPYDVWPSTDAKSLPFVKILLLILDRDFGRWTKEHGRVTVHPTHTTTWDPTTRRVLRGRTEDTDKHGLVTHHSGLCTLSLLVELSGIHYE